MKESNYYEELAVAARQLADAYEEIAFDKERLEDCEGNLALVESSYEQTMEANELLIQQVDDIGEAYEELARMIESFDEPAFNLIDQLLVNSIPSAAIPDYVNVVRRLMRLIYEKGIELREEAEGEEEDIDEEGVLF